MSIEVHPAADAFPMMNAEQFEGLKADIKENGQNDSIVYWKGQLIDGRNRLKACRELGIEPNECEVDEETEPVAFILSANLHRRHLTTAQRAMVASKLATLKNGGDRKSEEISSSNDGLKNSRDDAAKLLQVSTASVDRAKHVVANGSDDLVKAVEQGEINLNQAVKLVKAVEDKEEQSAIVKQGKEAVKEAVKPAPKPETVNEPEPEPNEQDDDTDEYDYPVVESFSSWDYKMNTLRKIIESLTSREKSSVKGWLK